MVRQRATAGARYAPLLETSFLKYNMPGRRRVSEEKFKKGSVRRRKFVEAQSM
jgi:hypothetical protein